MPSSCRHYISETLAPISLLERSLSPRASEHTQPPTPHSSHPTGYRRIDVAGGVATIVGRDEVRARRRRTSISDVGRHVAPPPPVPRCPLRAATRFFSPTWFLLSLSLARRAARDTHEPTGPEWALSADVARSAAGGEEMRIDFSPKGGPKDLLATWSPAKNAIEVP